MSQFKQDELISKNGKSYPVVGGRLRVAHEDNDHISISTELIQFEGLSHAVVKAEINTQKGSFSAYGVGSASKDQRLIDSLLELAETRAIARALRFAGYGVEYTGMEEIGDDSRNSTQWVSNSRTDITELKPIVYSADSATPPQLHAIEKIAELKHWNSVECCRRILKMPSISCLDDLSKDQASEVIGRMKEAA